MITLRDWFLQWGWTEAWAAAGAIVVVFLIAALFAELFRAVGPRLVSMIARPKKGWVPAFEKRHVFRSAAWVLIVIVTESLVTPVLESWPKALKLTETILGGALVVAVTITLSKSIAAVMDALEVQEGKEQRLPVKALGQALQLGLWTYATVIFLSVLSDRDVSTLLTGLAATGAVLVYVFRDPILGWTAGVQIAANDLARVGDWITVPEHDADGRVIEIALTTIKVLNWDKTIATIPTYALVSEGFRNWRGMWESRGRRMKRPVAVDANSVRFCNDALRDRLKQRGILADVPTDPGLTNLGCFRLWMYGVLEGHPEVRDDMLMLVRDLEPDGRGIPVEIYAFVKHTGVRDYERVQGEIFDNAVAMLPEFDLRLFQEPTGDDLRDLKPEEGT